MSVRRANIDLWKLSSWATKRLHVSNAMVWLWRATPFAVFETAGFLSRRTYLQRRVLTFGTSKARTCSSGAGEQVLSTWRGTRTS